VRHKRGVILSNNASSSKIRILRIIARLNIGGPAIHVVNLSADLPNHRFETRLVCGAINQDEGDMAYLTEEKDIKPIIIADLKREINLLDDIKVFFKLIKIIREFQPHIIDTHTAKAGTLGRFAVIAYNSLHPFRKRIRLIHTFHGHIFHGYFSRLKTSAFIWIERFLAGFTDKIIVISDLQKKDICDTFKIAPEKKVQTLPLGFDLSAFNSCRSGQNQNQNKHFLDEKGTAPFLVGIVGRLTSIKNHHMFLQTVRYLKNHDKIDDFRFLIVGDGELKTELSQKARKWGIDNYVEFAGWQKDMPSVYSTLDAVVLTSRNEGTPVTLIEAMASGVPVISTDVGGVPDLMGKQIEEPVPGVNLMENGILVGSEKFSNLANALIYLKDNYEIESPMTSRAKNYVNRHYSFDRLITDIKKLYQNLMYST